MNSQVEILLATYNGEQFIEQQLDSLLKQTLPSFCITVRDDQSTDKTLEIVRGYAARFPDKISVLPTQKNVGVTQNFSLLMQAAKSPYLMFCDQDDVWLPKKGEETWEEMQKLEKRAGAQTPCLVHTDLTVVNQQLQPIVPSLWHYQCMDPRRSSLNYLLVQNMVTGCTTMINRPLAELGKNLPQANVVMHDWWLALIATALGAISFVKKPSILYRQHGNNCLGAIGYVGMLKELLHQKARLQLLESSKQKMLQAKQFLTSFKSQLPDETKELLKEFVELPNQPIWQRTIKRIQRRFLPYGFFRKAYALLID